MKALVQNLAHSAFDFHVSTHALLSPSFQKQAIKTLQNPWLFLWCKLIIGFVSAYDIYLTVKYVEYLPQMELNPIGRVLMYLDSGPDCQLEQIACFVAAKFAGNFLTLAILERVRSWKVVFASLVAIVVAAFQIGLFCFLVTR